MHVVPFLVKGLTNYPIQGAVSLINPFSNLSYCVGLTPSFQCIQGASEYGNGRVVAFGHKSYMTVPQAKNVTGNDAATLLYNSLIWGSGSYSENSSLKFLPGSQSNLYSYLNESLYNEGKLIVVSAIGMDAKTLNNTLQTLNKMNTSFVFKLDMASTNIDLQTITKMVQSQPDVIIWRSYKTAQEGLTIPKYRIDERVERLLQYVQQGGSVVVGFTAWSWTSITTKSLHYECIFNEFLLSTGLYIAHESISAKTTPFPVDYAIGNETSRGSGSSITKLLSEIESKSHVPFSTVAQIGNLMESYPIRQFFKYSSNPSGIGSGLVDHVVQTQEKLDNFTLGIGKSMFHLPIKWPRISGNVTQSDAASAVYLCWMKRIAKHYPVRDLERYKPLDGTFPGSCDDGIRIEKHKFSILSNFKRFQTIGLYCPPGEVINIMINKQTLNAFPNMHFAVMVGSHRDELNMITPSYTIKRHGLISFKRLWIPNVDKAGDGEGMGTFAENGYDIKVGNLFGGIVYMEILSGIADDKPIALNFTATGGVRIPHFSNMKEVRALEETDELFKVFDKETDSYPYWKSTWDERISFYKGAPMAQLDGQHTSLTIPIHIAKLMNHTEMMQAINYWDQAVYHEMYLADAVDQQKNRAEHYVFDPQPIMGYMHSGYPIVVNALDLKIHGSNKLPRILDPDQMNEDIPWGEYHEFGHNLQNSLWTWEGMGEVSCNWFSMYACYRMNNRRSLQIPFVKQVLRDSLDYLTDSNKTYEDLIKNSNLAIMPFAVYAYHDNFKSLKETLARYKAGCCKTTPDKLRHLQWVRQTSLSVKQDLRALYAEWKWPLDNKYLEDLDKLPKYGGIKSRCLIMNILRNPHERSDNCTDKYSIT